MATKCGGCVGLYRQRRGLHLESTPVRKRAPEKAVASKIPAHLPKGPFLTKGAKERERERERGREKERKRERERDNKKENKKNQ